MSNSIFNIRFGVWHLQVTRDPLRVSFRRNPYQMCRRVDDPDWRWFELMEAPWK